MTTREEQLEAALKAMLQSVCGPTGFAEAVRHNSDHDYPWHSLDAAEAQARIAIATPATEPQGYALKPLVWRSARVSDRHERFSADSPWGRYEALQWSDGTFGGSLAPVDCDSDAVEFSVGSMAAAQAYCQADYTGRMKPLFAA